MPYTTQAQVATIIDVTPGDDLTAQIASADMLITRCCLASGYTTPELELIERYLAAHFYAIWQPRSQSEGAGSVQQTFTPVKADFFLYATTYGSQAMTFDTAGNLAGMVNTLAKVKGPLPGGPPRFGVKWIGGRRR